MFEREVKLKEATKRAKQLVDDLHREYPKSLQWNYSLMEQNLRDTYKALKNTWKNGKDLAKVKEYLSESGYKFLQGESDWADVKWFDLLECFDEELQDIAIISVVNMPGEAEDRFIAWLDHEKGASKNIDEMKADSIDGFDWIDNFPALSGMNLSIFGKPFMSVAGANDCWTFKWCPERTRWVLDFVAFDRFTDNYLSVLGKSVNLE